MLHRVISARIGFIPQVYSFDVYSLKLFYNSDSACIVFKNACPH